MEVHFNVLAERLIATSLQTTLLCILVWMLCRFVPRLSPASQCWLWWLVTLQMILGLTAGPVELPWLPQANVTSSATVPAMASLQAAPAGADHVPVIAASPVSDIAWPAWQQLVVLLWAAGAAVVAGIMLREWRRGVSLLRSSTPCVDQHLFRSLAKAVVDCRPPAAPELRVSHRIDSPLLIGYFRPVLLLPADGSLQGRELQMALVHELTHLRRGDLWWGLIPAGARLLFFFHPVAHLAVREYGIAREAACDAAVVGTADVSRRDYGLLLVRMGAATQPRVGIGVGSPTFKLLSRRLTMLQKSSFPAWAGVIAALAVAAGVMPLRLVAAAAPAIPQTAEPATAGPRAVPAPVPNATPGPAGDAGMSGRLPNSAQPATVEGPVITPERPAYTMPIAVRPLAAPSPPSVPPEQSAPSNFTIGIGDTLQVFVWRSPELSVTVPVRPDGRITIPLVNDILASGKSPTQLSRDIETALAKYVRGPMVNVIVTGVAPQSVPDSGALAELRRELADVRLRFTDNHPTVRALLSRIANLEQTVSLWPAAGPAEAAPAHRGENMSANFENVPVRILLQLIAHEGNANIVVSNSVSGYTALRVADMPWDQVLDIVLKNAGLEKRVQGNVIVVAPASELANLRM